MKQLVAGLIAGAMVASAWTAQAEGQRGCGSPGVDSLAPGIYTVYTHAMGRQLRTLPPFESLTERQQAVWRQTAAYAVAMICGDAPASGPGSEHAKNVLPPNGG